MQTCGRTNTPRESKWLLPPSSPTTLTSGKTSRTGERAVPRTTEEVSRDDYLHVRALKGSRY